MKKIKIKVAIIISVIMLILFNNTLVSFASMMHTVRPGENLWLLAQKYNTTVNQIKTINNHWSNRIISGDRLIIPGQAKTYVIQPGDTLTEIANRFNINVGSLRNMNGIWTDTIYPGKVLTIPQLKQDSIDTFSNKDLDLLARLVHGEARGESYEGKVAVAAVILNRVEDPKFPNNISGVVYQSLAFESVMDGQIHLRPDAESIKAAKAALNGWDPTGNALYFFNPAKVHSPTNWIWTRQVMKRIGNHSFAM